MPGPVPKPASQRRRRNVTAGARVLRGDVVVVRPPLPDTVPSEIHPLTLQWWNDVWASPMAAEFDASDVHGIMLLADLVNAYWNCPPDKLMTKKELAAEIRLQRQSYGLSPIDRRRLQWEIERAEQAQDQGDKRRQTSQSGTRSDPRLLDI